MKPSNEVKSEIEFLSPQRETLETKGKLTYNEGDRAFTNLKIKKEFLHEFPHLREKGEEFDFIYLMKLHRTFRDLKRELEILEKEDQSVPIVMFLGKEKKEIPHLSASQKS